MHNLTRPASYTTTAPRRDSSVATAARPAAVLLVFSLLVAAMVYAPSDPTPGLFGSPAETTTAGTSPS